MYWDYLKKMALYILYLMNFKRYKNKKDIKK